MAEQSPALDFWEITNLRRIQLGKKWKDVLAETELSHETLNRWRKGLKVDPLTDRAFERALLWAPGARETAAAGLSPRELDSETASTIASADTQIGSPSLEQELELAVRLLAAQVRELGLSPDEAEEAWRRVKERIVDTHEPDPGGRRQTPDHRRTG